MSKTGNRLIIFFTCLVFIFVLAEVYILYGKHLIAFLPAASKVYAPTIIPKPTPMTYKPPKSTGSSLYYSKIIVKQVNIKSLVNLNNFYQNPAYELLTAKGHYLLVDNGFSNNFIKTVVYDGNIVYSGNDFDDGWQDTSLSSNGLHYTYEINKTNGNGGFYIDSKKVMNQSAIEYARVTDSGDYFYISGPNGMVMKNNNIILPYATAPIYFYVSSDGKHYLITRDGAPIYDGHVLDIGKVLDYASFSPNGEHYGFKVLADINNNYHQYIDGKIVKINNLTDLTVYQLTDSGHITGAVLTSKDNATMFVDDHLLSKNIRKAIITDDGQHVLTQDSNGSWAFDNKPIQIQYDVKYSKIEIDGTTIYVYTISN